MCLHRESHVGEKKHGIKHVSLSWANGILFWLPHWKRVHFCLQ